MIGQTARKGVAAAIAPGVAAIALNGALGTTAEAQFRDEDRTQLTFSNNYLGGALTVSPQAAYSDNINLAPSPNENGEFVLSTLFSASGIVSTKRFTGVASGDLDFSLLTDEADFVVNQNLGGAGTATIAENIAYLDVAGETTRQLVGDNAAFSRNVNAARNQRVNVNSFQLSPYLNREFPSGAVAELRYRYSQAFTDQDNVGQTAGLLTDSRSQQVTAAFNTGPAYERLQIGIAATGSRVDETGSLALDDFQYEQGTVVGDIEYALATRFAVTGAVGFDEIRSDAPPELIPADELSGFFWRAGFRARPGRKTNLRLEYGDRFGEGFINAQFRYNFSERIYFVADAGRDFRSRAQNANVSFSSLQRRILRFADSVREGEGQSPEGIVSSSARAGGRISARAVGVAATTRASGSLFGVLDRGFIGGRISYQDEDFSFREIQTATASVFGEHRLSRRLTAFGDAFLRFADTSVDLQSCLDNPSFFGVVATPVFSEAALCAGLVQTNGETTTVGGRIGARYRFFKNVAAFGQYSHTNRFSPEPVLEFSENVVTVGLTVDF
ncbi:MAG: hypothetical protein ACFB00_08920 [Parvularculaceae bacterium]